MKMGLQAIALAALRLMLAQRRDVRRSTPNNHLKQARQALDKVSAESVAANETGMGLGWQSVYYRLGTPIRMKMAYDRSGLWHVHVKGIG
jgi:hypothetical protein